MGNPSAMRLVPPFPLNLASPSQREGIERLFRQFVASYMGESLPNDLKDMGSGVIKSYQTVGSLLREDRPHEAAKEWERLHRLVGGLAAFCKLYEQQQEFPADFAAKTRDLLRLMEDLAYQQQAQQAGNNKVPVTEDAKRARAEHTQAGYKRPGRAGKRAVLVYLDPDVGTALDKAVEASGLTQREFVEVAIRTAVADDPTGERARLVNALASDYQAKLRTAFPKL